MASSTNHPLIPSQPDEFRTKEYWENFFTKRENHFEWYSSWNDIKHVTLNTLERIRRQNHGMKRNELHILIVGCGNSDMSMKLYDAGYTWIDNIDFSEQVISQMRRSTSKYPTMQWHVMDATCMTFEDKTFDVVLDKGLLDAMLTSTKEDIVSSVDAAFSEQIRVLKKGGSLCVVSLLQKHVAMKLLCSFGQPMKRSDSTHVTNASTTSETSNGPQHNFTTQIMELATNLDSSMLSFWIEISKTHSNSVINSDNTWIQMGPENGKLIELKNVQGTEQHTSTRHTLSTITEALEFIQQSSDRYAQRRGLRFVRDGQRFIYHLNLPGPDGTSAEKLSPRFSITVVDVGKRTRCGVLLVPQGREHEWMFSEEEGQRQLAKDAGFDRLILVVLNRGHRFGDQSTVQAEITDHVKPLLPEGATNGAPFLAVAEDVGHRDVLFESRSELSGSFVVEDVHSGGLDVATTDSNSRLRRLIFASNPNAIQSEALIKLLPASSGASTTNNIDTSGLNKNQKKRLKKRLIKAGKHMPYEVDYSYLALEYHSALISAMSFANLSNLGRASIEKDTQSRLNILIVGLGGGALPMFLHHHFGQSMLLKLVELDPTVIQVAKDYFGLIENEHIVCCVDDGIKHIQSLAHYMRTSTDKGQPTNSLTKHMEQVTLTDKTTTSEEKVSQLPSQDTHSGQDTHSPHPMQDSQPTQDTQDIIVIDVDSKDLSSGISFPPTQFLEQQFLRDLHDSLTENGLLLINFACRVNDLTETTLDRIRTIFPAVHTLPVSEDSINQIIIAQKVSDLETGVISVCVGLDQLACDHTLPDHLDMDDWISKVHFDTRIPHTIHKKCDENCLASGKKQSKGDKSKKSKKNRRSKKR